MTNILITTIAILGIILIISFYKLMIKKNQDEKISKKTKGKGKVVAPSGPDDRYAEIINDFPTCFRNQQN